MAYHFSANQYEDAFIGKKLTNWTLPRKYKERPSAFEGYTQFIANNRGHLLRNIPRSKESPWGTFMGTWDMPRNIPPSRPSYTARSKHATDNLKLFKDTSPLNKAVNGFKPFKYEKQVKKFHIKSVATPPPSLEVKSKHEEGEGEARAVSGKPTSRRSVPSPLVDAGAGDRPISNLATPVQEAGSRPISGLGQSRPQSKANSAGPATKLINEGTEMPLATPVAPNDARSVKSRPGSEVRSLRPISQASQLGSPTKLINEGMDMPLTTPAAKPDRFSVVGSKLEEPIQQELVIS